MKDQLGGKYMTKFFGLRAKTYNYLINDEKGFLSYVKISFCPQDI